MGKVIITVFLSILIISCTSHEHDGLYLQGFQFKGIKDEVLKINGDEAFLDKYSYGGSFEGETKFPCEQYSNRIELTDNGTIKVLLLTDSGSLKLDDENEYQRFADFEEAIKIKPKRIAPLIETTADGKLQLNSQEHVKKEQERLDKEDGIDTNNTDETTSTNDISNDTFEGTKAFTDNERDWKFVVTIHDDDVLIKTYVGEKNTAHKKNSLNEIERGHFDNDTIVTPNNRYMYKDGKFYQLNYENGWNDYYEVK